MKTWEEMSEHEQLSCNHYELYKDVNGIRPRHINYDKLTVEEIKADMEYLVAQLCINEEEDRAREAEAIQVFEARVQETIKAGAGNRETAVRWLFDAENDPYVFNDPDYYCHHYGLPYGYFKQAA